MSGPQRAYDPVARIAELEAERDSTMVALRAVAQGYPIETQDDRYIVVENPKYQPDDGSNPKLVIDCWVETP